MFDLLCMIEYCFNGTNVTKYFSQQNFGMKFLRKNQLTPYSINKKIIFVKTENSLNT